MKEGYPKKEKGKFSKRESLVVTILFLITVALSCLFWLKKEIPLFWQKITAPYKMTIEK